MAGHKAPKRHPRGGFQPGPAQLALEAMIRERLSAVIAAERGAHRLTQEELAERAGIHVTTIGKIERGRQVPSLALFALLAKALACSPVDLLCRILPEEPSAYEDRAVALVRGFLAADRAKLVPVLEAIAGLHSRP
ncbi:MAG: helix-turn-helix transcriptional regulator [Polyangia bacterium]|jgi:transcriptional regulator with XRE-family HTH domain